MITIRSEQPGDGPAIRLVHEQAFGQPAEANLVEALRPLGDLLISLVALLEGQIVGHILFSPVTIDAPKTTWEAMALGPLAVLPEFQERTIGSQLVEAGLDACMEAGQEVIVVLGHPGFYPRFGFVPASPLGIRWELDAPQDAFMVAELRPGSLAGRTGVVRFRQEFAGV